METRENMTLASLLSEMGRVCIRSGRKPYAQLGPDEATFLWLREREQAEVRALAEILVSETRGDIIRKARSALVPSMTLAVSERPESVAIPLISLLSQVSIEKHEEGKQFVLGPSEPHGVPLLSLSEEVAFPRPIADLSISCADYDSLLALFEDDFAVWARSGSGVAPLLMILEKHFHSVPLCPGSQEPDGREISLFDHVKALAGLVTALHRHRECQEAPSATLGQDKELCFIGGDVSGLQGFLYSLSSKGALKTLRARSFFLELLCEHSVSELIAALHLNEANMIYCGGGRFNILSHLSKSVPEILRAFETKINSHLRHFGDLSLVLAMEPVSLQEICSNEVVILRRALGIRISRLKARKHLDSLDRILAPREPVHATSSCSVCNTDEVPPEDFRELERGTPEGTESNLVCPFCFSMTQLGAKLGNWRYLAAVTSGTAGEGFVLPCHDGSSLVYQGYQDLRSLPPHSRKVFCLSSWEIGDYPGPHARQMLVANKVRKKRDLSERGRNAEQESGDPESSASFEGLAACSRGLSRIGVLRMDVDHLGNVFATGLGDRVSFTRLASLSRNLSLFFKQQVPRICEGKLGSAAENLEPSDFSDKHPELQGRNVSVVYSGGDDLFIVGAWDELLEVSFDVARSFKSYCASNPALSISAGITASSTSLPLHTMARMAGRAERASKRQGRSRITFFGVLTTESASDKAQGRSYTVEWQHLEQDVLAPLKMFLNLSELDEQENRFKPYFSTGLIYGLLRLHELWRQSGKLYLPRMAYMLSRLRISLEKIGLSHLEETKARLFKRLMTEGEMKHLHIPLTWFAMLCRNGGEREA